MSDAENLGAEEFPLNQVIQMRTTWKTFLTFYHQDKYGDPHLVIRHEYFDDKTGQVVQEGDKQITIRLMNLEDFMKNFNEAVGKIRNKSQ